MYHKTHIIGGNETTWREKAIKDNYEFIKTLFPHLP
jgi:hypothetical protein